MVIRILIAALAMAGAEAAVTLQAKFLHTSFPPDGLHQSQLRLQKKFGREKVYNAPLNANRRNHPPRQGGGYVVVHRTSLHIFHLGSTLAGWVGYGIMLIGAMIAMVAQVFQKKAILDAKSS